jgi:hypothetical protein
MQVHDQRAQVHPIVRRRRRHRVGQRGDVLTPASAANPVHLEGFIPRADAQLPLPATLPRFSVDLVKNHFIVEDFKRTMGYGYHQVSHRGRRGVVAVVHGHRVLGAEASSMTLMRIHAALAAASRAPHHGMTPHIFGSSLSSQARSAADTREILESALLRSGTST